MPGTVRPVADERDGLLAYLAHERHILRTTVFGLTDGQARATPTVSTLSVGGLIKHVAHVERTWMDTILQRRNTDDAQANADTYMANFVLRPDETLDSAFANYDEAAKETEAVIADIADLGQAVPVPRDQPWFPKDVEAWSVRWVACGAKRFRPTPRCRR